MIRVLLADDHEVLRWGLVQILTSQPDVEVVGEVSNGEAAVVASHVLAPDVLLLDLSMSGGDGWTALGRVLDDRPDACVVILSASDDPRTVDTALRRGAKAHVSKSAGSVHLLRVLRAVAGPVVDPVDPVAPVGATRPTDMVHVDQRDGA